MKKCFTVLALIVAVIFSYDHYRNEKVQDPYSEENLRKQLPGDIPEVSFQKYVNFFDNVRKKKEKKSVQKDKPGEAVKHEFQMTRDPNTNTVPKERLLKAYEYAEELRQSGSDDPIGGITWQERGPNNVGGRTRAILVDANDPDKKTIFAGGVAGGLWKTTDITALQPNWVQINDFFENLAITTIVQNPLNTQEIYFGTGEGWHNVDAIRGLGIWKSTNGGINFSQLPATNNNLSFYRIQKIIIHPVTGHIYAATRDDGVMRSTNGGNNWSKVLGDGMGGLTNKAADLEIGADNSIYATLGMVFSPPDGIYKSATGDAGGWTKLNTGINGFPIIGINRIEIACAPTNANVLYALTQSETTFGIEGVYKTIDGGLTFISLPLPVDSDPFIGADFTRTQAWYDLIAAVDPNNADIVYVGGIDLFKSINGGFTWNQISHWYGLVHQDVHADQHAIVFEPGNSNVIYFGNDGGVYRSADGTELVPTIKSKEHNYNTTQFYACAIHPEAGEIHFLAGSQDNGSHKFTSAGMNSTPEITGGDGAFCHIDKNQPQYQYTSYVFNNYFRSTDGGESFTQISISDDGQFINPTDYDHTNNMLYCGKLNGSYLRWNNPQTGSTTNEVTVTAFAGGKVTAVKVGNTNNRVYFGLDNGKIVRVDDAHAGTSLAGVDISTGLPAAYLSCIEVENGNDDHIIVTYSNYGVNSIWETVNGGTSWTSIEGNLPDMPVRWVIFNPLNNDQALAATDLGVWSTDNLNGGSTVWGPSNNGLANVSTHMLKYRESDNFVIAATHGRGLFSTDAFSPASVNFTSAQRVSFIGKQIQFTDGSTQASSWLWNFGDGATSTSQNPQHAYLSPGVYTVTLTINGSLTETKTDYITIMPERGTPYGLSDGGDFEVNANDFANETLNGTKWERGNSSVTGKDGTHSPVNAWVTGIDDPMYLDNTTSSLYTPDFNFTAAGTYTFKFWSKFVTEATWDGFRVEYSTDKGETWLPLGSFDPVNWYNTPNNILETVFPVNEPYFSGVQSAYKQFMTDASFLAGNSSVVFRFIFKTDTNTPDIGIAIDDFELDGPVNIALPVELASFTAAIDRRDVHLNWMTASEINNSGFDVERSNVRGETSNEWAKIGFINGNGTTNESKNYSFTDRGLNTGKYNYRLKQIDYNGNFEYFNLSNEVSIGIPDKYDLSQNYPNPFNPTTKINFDLPFDSKVTMKIFDITGREITTLVNDIHEAGYYTVTFDGKGVASGVYFYRIIAEGGNQQFVMTKRMVMVK
jgi:PKD repeat protein